MEVYIYNRKPFRTLLGIGQYKLSKPLAYFYKEEDDRQYTKKWYDFLKLAQTEKEINENLKRKNRKIQ